MKLRYTVTMELDDGFWGFSNYLDGEKLTEIAKEQILDLISEDIGAALDSCTDHKLQLIK